MVNQILRFVFILLIFRIDITVLSWIWQLSRPKCTLSFLIFILDIGWRRCFRSFPDWPNQVLVQIFVLRAILHASIVVTQTLFWLLLLESMIVPRPSHLELLNLVCQWYIFDLVSPISLVPRLAVRFSKFLLRPGSVKRGVDLRVVYQISIFRGKKRVHDGIQVSSFGSPHPIKSWQRRRISFSVSYWHKSTFRSLVQKLLLPFLRYLVLKLLMVFIKRSSPTDGWFDA